MIKKTNFRNLQFQYMENLEKLRIKSILSNESEVTTKEQVIQVFSTIEKLMSKNKSLLANIRQLSPQFIYDLYRPKKIYDFAWDIEKELKLGQIDKLLQQQEQLSKKMHELKVRKYFRELDQVKTIKKNQNEFKYEDLKNILSSTGDQTLSCVERIDQLNIAIKKFQAKVEVEYNYQKLSFRKEKQQEVNNPCIPSKLYWKMKYKIQELQIALKRKTQENFMLMKIIQEKEAHIYRAAKNQQILQAQLKNCLIKLSGIHENLEIYENSIEQQNFISIPSSTPQFDYLDDQQSLKINIQRNYKSQLRDETRKRSPNQIYKYLNEETTDFEKQFTLISKKGEDNQKGKISQVIEQKIVSSIVNSCGNKKTPSNDHWQKIAKQSTLRNCQSHPNIIKLNSTQILNIQNTSENQNKASFIQSKGTLSSLRFKRTVKNQKQKRYFFAEAFL